MKKRILALILVFTLIFSMSISVFGANENIAVILNGDKFSLENTAYMNEEGRVMVPVRQILEALAYEVNWNDENRSVTAVNGLDLVEFKIGETGIYFNKEEFNILEEPVIKNDTTFVPLELLSSVFDLVIGWDNKYQVLNITNPTFNTEGIFDIADDEEIKENLSTYLKALEKNNGFFGSVLVAKDGKVLIDEGYGYSDVDQLTMNKPQTKFAIGSVTKQFVATAIMQLSEKGLISVEDKVSKYFPDFPNGDLITIHHLLTHTSGIVNFTELPEFLINTDELEGPTDVLELVMDKELLFNPGETFSYCNTNYLMLGLIVEDISGMPYEDYLRKNIFEPLNMNRTGFAYEEANKIQDATAYSGHLEVSIVDDEVILSNAYGAGSIYSTVEDLYRWEQALNTQEIIKSETIEAMFGEHIDMLGSGEYYGYGWMSADLGFDRIIFHGGNTLGFTAELTRLVDSNLSIIILSNKGYVDLNNVRNSILNIVFGGEFKVPEAKEVVEIQDTSIYDRYVGRYDLLPEVNLNVLKMGDGLYAEVADQGLFQLFPRSENSFFAKIADVEIEFIIDEEGEVNELIFTQGGFDINATKIGETQEEGEAVAVDTEIYNDYVGEYQLIPGLIVTISREENRIFAQLTGQTMFEIFPESEDAFFYKVVEASITFIRDEEGKVVELLLKQAGQELTGNKL